MQFTNALYTESILVMTCSIFEILLDVLFCVFQDETEVQDQIFKLFEEKPYHKHVKTVHFVENDANERNDDDNKVLIKSNILLPLRFPFEVDF